MSLLYLQPAMHYHTRTYRLGSRVSLGSHTMKGGKVRVGRTLEILFAFITQVKKINNSRGKKRYPKISLFPFSWNKHEQCLLFAQVYKSNLSDHLGIPCLSIYSVYLLQLSFSFPFLYPLSVSSPRSINLIFSELI